MLQLASSVDIIDTLTVSSSLLARHIILLTSTWKNPCVHVFVARKFRARSKVTQAGGACSAADSLTCTMKSAGPKIKKFPSRVLRQVVVDTMTQI